MPGEPTVAPRPLRGRRHRVSDRGVRSRRSSLFLVLAGAPQIGLVIHVRNTVIDSAIAGARQAGLADQTASDGDD
ncbi:hypothetical protein IOD13_11605 [Brevibacterium casei]|nr:hypothetical protein [Brevibacterium casei]